MVDAQRSALRHSPHPRSLSNDIQIWFALRAVKRGTRWRMRSIARCVGNGRIMFVCASNMKGDATHGAQLGSEIISLLGKRAHQSKCSSLNTFELIYCLFQLVPEIVFNNRLDTLGAFRNSKPMSGWFNCLECFINICLKYFNRG